MFVHICLSLFIFIMSASVSVYPCFFGRGTLWTLVPLLVLKLAYSIALNFIMLYCTKLCYSTFYCFVSIICCIMGGGCCGNLCVGKAC